MQSWRDYKGRNTYRKSLIDRLVVHLDRFDLNGHLHQSECDSHTGQQDTGLDTADRHGTNTTDLVDVLQRKINRFVGSTLRRLDLVTGLEEGVDIAPTHAMFE